MKTIKYILSLYYLSLLNTIKSGDCGKQRTKSTSCNQQRLPNILCKPLLFSLEVSRSHFSLHLQSNEYTIHSSYTAAQQLLFQLIQAREILQTSAQPSPFFLKRKEPLVHCLLRVLSQQVAALRPTHEWQGQTV
ncbi:hypothetical protein FGO68_gene7635 [Halteria grandinella]|uniref:Uncharacterized protein n=1 Tax=Halteria grandinella TaxID=5974 RepID=A0A8J8NV75_HALGN|nr:hypothetical protein FGO68_gene7635 [Halteria grandinella]